MKSSGTGSAWWRDIKEGRLPVWKCCVWGMGPMPYRVSCLIVYRVSCIVLVVEADIARVVVDDSIVTIGAVCSVVCVRFHHSKSYCYGGSNQMLLVSSIDV